MNNTAKTKQCKAGDAILIEGMGRVIIEAIRTKAGRTFIQVTAPNGDVCYVLPSQVKWAL